jgi:putative transposase
MQPTSITSSNFINLSIGAHVFHNDQEYVITDLLDIQNILAKDISSMKIKRLPVNELSPIKDNKVSTSENILQGSTTIPDEDWNLAIKRFEIIHPILLTPDFNRTRKMVAERAAEFGKDASTLYRWISKYESTGLISSLVKNKRSDKGKTKINPDVEKIIALSIETVYLNKQKHSIKYLCEDIFAKCRQAGLDRPHPCTIRNRISEISDELKVHKRLGFQKAMYTYQENKNHFPGADYPLSFVQIDHTKLDVILVDDTLRCSIGRPWITLAFDVFSRMVCGFYISFDPPGAMATGLCIAHAILPKEKWLVKKDISASWPVWGISDNIHLDNAKEFRGNMLRRACQEYNISLNWRPVARPHYGGHIERMLGTLLKDLHDLPGTTFSNPNERGKYNSDAKAAMTIDELEKWLTFYLLEVYHKRIHSELKMPPEQKWELGLLGDDKTPGRGLPTRIVDEQKLILDFMPYVERTIQEYGVVIDEIYYYSDILRPWISARDPKNRKLKRKFIFKRDPRNISHIYFFDPDINLYFKIPYRNTSHPPISIWELKEAQRFVKSKMEIKVNEIAIFSAYEKMSEIEKESIKKSKKARRSFQRKIDSNKKAVTFTPANPLPTKEKEVNITTLDVVSDIKAFDDIDDNIDDDFDD